MTVLQNKIKPVAGYTTIEAVVKAVLRDTYDDSGSMRLRFESWAIQGWKEELTIDVIRETKKVFLPIVANTKTVKLPPDCIDYVVIGIVDIDNMIRQLSRNDTITPPLIDDSAMKSGCECECRCTGELCSDLLKISTVEEVTELGIKTVKTRTCENGDVIQEITEPTTIATKVNTCNYSISIADTCNACSYEVIIPGDPATPFSQVSFIKNGVEIFLGVISDIPSLNAAMEEQGFTVISSERYKIFETCDVYTTFTYVNNGDQSHDISFAVSDCEDISTIVFPITIDSYVKNDEIVDVGLVVNTIDGLNDFFVSLGFSVDGIASYHLSGSSDSFVSLTYTESATSKTSIFTPYDCVISYVYTVELITKTINICNLAVKPCGCPLDTPENISTCSTCFGCYPGCWNGCSLNESEFPTPSNDYGEYRIIKELGLIQLAPSTFPYKKLYLEYYSDGLAVNGVYHIPAVAAPALRSYVYWQSIFRKRGIQKYEKEMAWEQFVGDRSRAKKRISRTTLKELYDSIRTLPII